MCDGIMMCRDGTTELQQYFRNSFSKIPGKVSLVLKLELINDEEEE